MLSARQLAWLAPSHSWVRYTSQPLSPSQPFDSIIPKYLPGPPHAYTHGSGVAELGTAALLANEKTRRLGGLVAALLFVAVFPANIQMAVDARNQSTQRKAIAYGRLPLQLPMICSALKIWRKSK